MKFHLPSLLPFLAAVPAFAVTDTWDGNLPNAGAGDSLFSTALNWADNTAPVSDLVNTDLIFAGTTKTAPIVSTAFNTNSVTFNNTAGAFTFSGSAFTLGAGGIVNNDADTQTFSNQITVGTAATTFSAASGPLSFGTVALGANTLNVAATTGTSSITALTGTGTVNKSGNGTLNFGGAGAVTQNWDLNMTAGSFAVNAATNLTVSGTGSMTSASTGGLFVNGNLTMNGTTLALTSTDVTLAAGKLLTISGGGTLTEANAANFTGAGGVVITGAGSTMQHLSGSPSGFSGGASLSVLAGADATALSGDFGTGSAGSLLVDGSGSTYTISNATNQFFVGRNAGGNGTALFTNGATGSLAEIELATSAGVATGMIDILSGSGVTASQLTMANMEVVSLASFQVAGTGSVVTISGAGKMDIGAASLSEANLLVNAGGTLHTGTGTGTVNSTGTISIGGGTFNANGNLDINGGQFHRDATGVFNLAAGRTLTVQNGGDAFFEGALYEHATASTVTVTGAGSTLFTNANNPLRFRGGSTLNVQAGGTVSANGALLLAATASGGSATVLVDGPGSLLSGAGGTWGAGAAANVTLSNSAAGTFFGALALAGTFAAGTAANVNVLSGATLSMSSLVLANATGSVTGSLTVDGAGSAVSIGGSGVATIGSAVSTTATVNVQNGGTFNTGTGTTTVNATGQVNINAGTFNANGNVTLNGTGAQLNRIGSGVFNLALGTSLSVQNGADVTISSLYQQTVRANLAVSGAGSTFTTGGDFQWEGGNSTLSIVSVNSGGRLSCGGSLHLGRNNTAVSLSASGAGTQISAANPLFASEWQAAVLLTSGANATLVALKLADVNFGGASASGSLDVQSGATVTLGNLTAATVLADCQADITVDGNGSSITQTGASILILGASAFSSASLSVNNGGTFTSGTVGFTLNATGTVNVGGGTATFKGPLTNNGGTVNFTSGALLFTHPSVNLTVGNNGLLGQNLTLDASQRLELPGTTTVEAFRTLTLDGGIFRTGSLVNNGALAFNTGTLGITGAGGLALGGGGPFGSSLTLGAGANLQVTNAVDAVLGSTLTLNGGTLSSGSYTNTGTARFNVGTATCHGFNNLGSGRVFLGDTLILTSDDFANGTNSRLIMEGGILLGIALSNAGLLSGSGTIAVPLTNLAAGEIRAEAGKTLLFEGSPNTNRGRLNLQGGALYFTAPVNNLAAGQINGSGILSFPASTVPSAALPLAGLNNSGQMNLSGGDSLIFGTIQMQSGSKLIASGGAVATFFDVFRHSGAEVKASAASALVFFGEVRGAGSFTGTGTIYMEGGYSPGSSPASVSLAPQIVFTETNTLALEIGGLTPGTEHDKLTFTHAASPQVTWGGTLTVTLINGFTPAAGQSFDVFDFDNTRDAGTFATLALPALPAGLTWDTTQLYTDGTLRIIPTGLTFAAWATASGIPGALPGDDHDSDGFDNASEFALGLFPPQPGTVLPDGGFHTYGDGERLRLLFTRPLDRTGVTLKVQASADLTTWEDLATSVNSAPFTGPGFVSENRAHPLDQPGLVEVRDILTASTGARRQIRVRITLAP